MATLEPSAPEIRQFLEAIFRYADEGTFISLRAFDQKARSGAPVLIEGVKVNGDLSRVVAQAASAAARAANGTAPAVFAPPVATFNNPRRARAADVANGVALSVELDEGDPRKARAKLESILGPVTVAVASGGEWADPETGELHPKMHLHWRLAEPTRTPEDHAKLREARWLAAVLVGGDRTAAPPAHPLRWPGSWNLKRQPRLARIAAGNPASEVHLEDALERLQEAVEAAGFAGQGLGPRIPGEPQAPVEDVAAALRHVPNADLHWDDWNRLGMATWRATGGAPEGLEAWEAWSAKSGKHDPAACADRWQHFATSPPSKIGAGTIFFLARAAGWTGRGGARLERPPPFPERAEGEAPPTTNEAGAEAPKQDGDASGSKPALRFSDAAWDESKIPPRPWLARGYLLRGSVSLAAGMGSAGKSSLMCAWACALALGMDHGRFQPVQPLRVLTYNVEDDEDEQRRRFSAALRQFERTPRDLKGRLMRVSPEEIGTLVEHDAITGKFRMTDAWNELEQICQTWKPDVIMLDPLAELHTAEENNNTALRHVIAIVRAMARRHNAAGIVVHHFRKGGEAGDMEAIRGAGAIVGAVRVALTVTPMSKEEANEFGIPADLRRRFFRVDNAKSNYSPAGEAEWHELVGVELDNGEEVAAAVPWTPPGQSESRHKGTPPEALALVAAAVERGTDAGPYSPKLSLTEPRSVAAVMARYGITDERAQKAAFTALIQQGFTVQEFRNANRVVRQGLRAPSGRPAARWITPDAKDAEA